jgi:hypothetical protein
MDAMETETYDTIRKKCLARLLDKLSTKMPTAGDTERDMLAARWENEVDKDEALDAEQAKQIDAQLQRPFKQLLKHLNGKNPKPPPGWQPLASAALGAMLAQLDGPVTGARVSGTLVPSAEQRDGLREDGRMAVAARRMQMDLEAEVLRLRAETAAQKRSIDALTEASKKSTAAQRVSNATLALAEMSAAAYEQVLVVVGIAEIGR